MEIKLRLAGLIDESVVDGPGLRFVLFAQGCKHKCPGCHNLQTHSFDGGDLITISQLLKKITSNCLIRGVTFSGGEPFEQAEGFFRLGCELKKLNYSVVTYTGYRFEELIERGSHEPNFLNLLQVTDLLIDGKFEIAKRDLSLAYRGSTNQRIIDVSASMAFGKLVELDVKNLAI